MDKRSPLSHLLRQAALIGGIFSMGYDSCLILTNDRWRSDAGGIPRHTLLLAIPAYPHTTGLNRHALLLRVTGPAPLPASADLNEVRTSVTRLLVTGMQANGQQSAEIDAITRSEIQFSALSATILGTFFQSGEGSPVSFGSDVADIYASNVYAVYKPFGASLQWIVGFPGSAERQDEARVDIGRLRYTAAEFCPQNAAVDTAVPVYVNIADFVRMKTAILGMTRLGKSNTLKILATAIFMHARQSGRKVGQLIIDPTGEYASSYNVQDQTSLSQLGPEHVSVFAYDPPSGQLGASQTLMLNFFSRHEIATTWALITGYLNTLPHAQSGYLKRFMAVDVIGPMVNGDSEEKDWSEHHRAQRRLAALYAVLLRANFTPPKGFSVEFAARKEVAARVNTRLAEQGHHPVGTSPNGRLQLDSRSLCSWFDALLEAREEEGFPAGWIDSEMEAILDLYSRAVGAGYTLLEPLRAMHTPYASGDYARSVLHELEQGKIVVVDLSRGPRALLENCVERIIRQVIAAAVSRFRNGEALHDIQIYLEEAHKLFSSERILSSTPDDPYVVLAKEAAKYHIGLVYTTQEVTGVDHEVLSNTSNWVVAHLNSRREIKALSDYYDFADFAEQILNAENPGFVRLRTRSCPYTLPVQIRKFEAGRVAAARQAASPPKERNSHAIQDEERVRESQQAGLQPDHPVRLHPQSPEPGIPHPGGEPDQREAAG